MMVWIRCPVRACSVPTGIEVSAESFAMLPEAVDDFACNACGRRHPWVKREAWLSENRPTEKPTLRCILLPASRSPLRERWSRQKLGAGVSYGSIS